MGNISLPEAARRFSLPPSTLGNWVKAQKTGRLGEIGKIQRPLTEIEKENYRLKKELAEVRMERDLLKKSGRVLLLKAPTFGRRSRYPVRDEERDATRISYSDDVPYLWQADTMHT